MSAVVRLVDQCGDERRGKYEPGRRPFGLHTWTHGAERGSPDLGDGGDNSLRLLLLRAANFRGVRRFRFVPNCCSLDEAVAQACRAPLPWLLPSNIGVLPKSLQ